MRMAGRFSRRIHGYAKAEGIPLVHCQAGERKHELAEEYLAKPKSPKACFWFWWVEPRRRCGTSAPTITLKHRQLFFQDFR